MLKIYEKKGRLEAGIDEAGRGSLIGRVYVGAVIMPFELEEDKYLEIKDSKKLSKKKREELSEYIKEVALDYAVCYADNNIIDKKNILQATIETMHDTINALNIEPEYLLIDGNKFIPIINKRMEYIPYTCVKQGDNKYLSIAAASILAKVEHDRHIEQICYENNELNKYDLMNNMGYGTKKHLDAIEKYGITELHRKTFGICKKYKV
jgi:ribonuclease HII